MGAARDDFFRLSNHGLPVAMAHKDFSGLEALFEQVLFVCTDVVLL
jgi:hypothetical protein